MKLADFGLAWLIKDSLDNNQDLVSDYIATRWYWAPEILLGSKNYSKKVDIWSAGCILGEVLLEQVLFAGNNSVN
jgi:mitogen-activated protein kinase 15